MNTLKSQIPIFLQGNKATELRRHSSRAHFAIMSNSKPTNFVCCWPPYYFFHEKVPYFGDFLVGTEEPLPYCNKITFLYGCGFGLKKLGLADPPLQLGQNPKKIQKSDLKAPLKYLRKHCSLRNTLINTNKH